MTYSGKDKHESRYIIKKRSSEYKGRQQECQDTQRWAINKKSYHRSRSGSNLREQSSKRNHFTREN